MTVDSSRPKRAYSFVFVPFSCKQLRLASYSPEFLLTYQGSIATWMLTSDSNNKPIGVQ